MRDRVVGLGLRAGERRDVSVFAFERAQEPSRRSNYLVQKMEANVTIDPADFALPASLRTEEKKCGIVGIK